MKYIETELLQLMNRHLRTGSLKAKRTELERLLIMVRFIHKHHAGVRSIKNIGRRQIYEFYEFLEETGAAESTIYKYGLAVSKFWDNMEFSGESPMPKVQS